MTTREYELLYVLAKPFLSPLAFLPVLLQLFATLVLDECLHVANPFRVPSVPQEAIFGQWALPCLETYQFAFLQEFEWMMHPGARVAVRRARVRGTCFIEAFRTIHDSIMVCTLRRSPRYAHIATHSQSLPNSCSAALVRSFHPRYSTC